MNMQIKMGARFYVQLILVNPGLHIVVIIAQYAFDRQIDCKYFL